MVAEPCVTPVTVPDALTEAVPAADVDHEPVGVALERADVLPVHIVVVPVIAAGATITETDAVVALPQPVV